MTEYHKILTVYKRDPATKYRTLLEGEFACPEFEYLSDLEWIWTEKIDGTNMRVIWDIEDPKIRFGGKTDRANIPSALMGRMLDLFNHQADWFQGVGGNVTLYGEGYGAGVQKGGKYGPIDFILFDVRVEEWWLKRDDVADVAEKLGVKLVPEMGRGPLEQAVKMVRAGILSAVAKEERPAEGLVMRPAMELFGRDGKRIIAKIKHKDFGG